MASMSIQVSGFASGSIETSEQSPREEKRLKVDETVKAAAEQVFSAPKNEDTLSQASMLAVDSQGCSKESEAVKILQVGEVLKTCPKIFAQGVAVEKDGSGGFNQNYSPEGCPSGLAGAFTLPENTQYYSAPGAHTVDAEKLYPQFREDCLEMDSMQTSMWKLVNTSHLPRYFSNELLYPGNYSSFSSNQHLHRYLYTKFPQLKTKYHQLLSEELTSKSPRAFISEQISRINSTCKDALAFSNAAAFLTYFYEGIGNASWNPYSGTNFSIEEYRLPSLLPLLGDLEGVDTFPIPEDITLDQIFALTLIKMHAEALSVHKRLLEERVLSTDGSCSLRYAEMEKDESLQVTLLSVPSEKLDLSLYDTIPFFELLNSYHPSQSLNRELFCDIILYLGFVGINCIVNGEIPGHLHHLFPHQERIPLYLEQLQKLNELPSLPGLVVIQDAPHDVDDQVYLGVAFALARRGVFSEGLHVVEGATNNSTGELYTQFPMVYAELYGADTINHPECISFSVMPGADRKWLTSGGKEMPLPIKQSHKRQDEKYREQQGIKIPCSTFSLDTLRGKDLLVTSPSAWDKL